MNESMNSVLYLLLSACLALLAGGLWQIAPSGKSRMAGPEQDTVSEPEHGDLHRFLLGVALLFGIAWGMTFLPIARIGLTEPGWTPYAGAAAIAIGAYVELTRPRKGDDFEVAGRLFMASLGCLWAAIHIHEMLEGKLW